jgi:hypothetical protein
MKKLVVFALMTFAFLATAKTTVRDIPWPTCNPCPFIH